MILCSAPLKGPDLRAVVERLAKRWLDWLWVVGLLQGFLFNLHYEVGGFHSQPWDVVPGRSSDDGPTANEGRRAQ